MLDIDMDLASIGSIDQCFNNFPAKIIDARIHHVFLVSEKIFHKA
jgi:hypothetical protein